MESQLFTGALKMDTTSYKYQSLNECLVKMSAVLLEESVKRQTRGYVCYELPEPVIIQITNPCARVITVPERKWNKYLPFAESLWIASGRNDIEMSSYYCENLKTFSDDGIWMRAGYGPRVRRYNNDIADYQIGFNTDVESGKTEIDQFKYVIDSFKKDEFTRQAIINIGDPVKDCFDGDKKKETKDFPCTRSLQFLRDSEGKLNLYVHMRSNDFLWGATGVNMFNYMFMLEYFSMILGYEVGSYYHLVNNLHYYEDTRERIESFSKVKSYSNESYSYRNRVASLTSFEVELKRLEKWEQEIRTGRDNNFIKTENEFFHDWALALYSKRVKTHSLKFHNPVLNSLFNN